MLNDIGFFQNDQITGISETNIDFIPQLNSEDNIISSPIHYSTELQDNINSLIEGDDNISENIYFNKNPTLNNLIPSVKKDIKINEKTVSTNERKNNCNNTIYGRKKKNSIEKNLELFPTNTIKRGKEVEYQEQNKKRTKDCIIKIIIFIN